MHRRSVCVSVFSGLLAALSPMLMNVFNLCFLKSGFGQLNLPEKKQLDSVAAQSNEFSDQLITTVSEATSAIASDLVRCIKADHGVQGHIESGGLADNSDDLSTNSAERECESLLDDRLASAARLLLSAAICIDEIRGDGTTCQIWSEEDKEEYDSKPRASRDGQKSGSILDSEAIRRTLGDAMLGFRPAMGASTSADSVDMARAAAFRELQEAMEILQSELCEP